MIITILVDSKNSWYVEYAKLLESELRTLGHSCSLVHNKNNIMHGDVCFMLSCTKILPAEYLGFNKNNIVIHASDLPAGKGFSPLQWQILEGKNDITLTLFEAVEALDAGDYYLKSVLNFKGNELLPELRHKMAVKINEMAVYFIENFDKLEKTEQEGVSTYYPRLTEENDQIDPNKSIIELFNHFRIADNSKFPLFFEHLDKKFTIRIQEYNGE